MATAKRGRKSRGTILFRVLLLFALISAGLWLAFGREAAALSEVGTAYAAKTACACRHIADREIGSCHADLGSGFSTLWLSEDAEERSVTASIPGLASTTATYSGSWGCVLERWES